MNKKIITLITCLSFIVGYMISEQTSYDKEMTHVIRQNNSENKNEIEQQTIVSQNKIKLENKNFTLQASKEKSDQIFERNGQDFFRTVFDKYFWTSLDIHKLKNLTNSYKVFQDKKEESKFSDNDSTKIGFFRAMNLFYLNQNLPQDVNSYLVKFHKKILNTEKNLLVKRQVMINLKKIINFDSELKRDEFLAKADKRASYLSELTTDEIIQRVMNEQ